MKGSLLHFKITKARLDKVLPLGTGGLDGEDTWLVVRPLIQVGVDPLRNHYIV